LVFLPTTKAVGYLVFLPTTKAVGYLVFLPTTKAVGSYISTNLEPTALVVGARIPLLFVLILDKRVK